MPAALVPMLPALLQAAGILVLSLIGWLTVVVKNKTRADSAQQKLALLAMQFAGKAWDSLGPVVQNALADGKLTPEERILIEKAAAALFEDATDKATLEQIAKDLGLPFAGIIASLTASFIDTWTKAHDPTITSASQLAYPVNSGQPMDATPINDTAHVAP